MTEFKYIMNEEELSRGCSHAPLRRTDQETSRKQNQVIIQKYFYVPGNIWPIEFQNHSRPVITLCHSCIPFLNHSVDYRYTIPIPIGFLAHLPWHVVKKRSKSLWPRGWTLLFTFSYCFLLPVKWIIYHCVAKQLQSLLVERMYASTPLTWTWPPELFGP